MNRKKENIYKLLKDEDNNVELSSPGCVDNLCTQMCECVSGCVKVCYYLHEIFFSYCNSGYLHSVTDHSQNISPKQKMSNHSSATVTPHSRSITCSFSPHVEAALVLAVALAQEQKCEERIEQCVCLL